MTSQATRLLTRSEAARRLRDVYHARCENSSLAKRAHDGTGPPYRLIGGRAMYAEPDVDAYGASLIGPPVRRTCDARTRAASRTGLSGPMRKASDAPRPIDSANTDPNPPRHLYKPPDAIVDDGIDIRGALEKACV